jgi:hypothetical protein
MLGYLGGLFGPLIVGGILDLAAGTQNALGYAYLSVGSFSVASRARSCS